MSRPPSFFFDARCRRATGFSLIEVTLALGIITFALVGAVGVLPTALSSGRRSINENRAAAIAETILASFRSQPFQSVCYLDGQCDANGQPLPSPSPAPLDLNLSTQLVSLATTTPPGGVQLYATILDGFTPGDASDTFANLRHLRFGSAQVSASDYLVTMYFNNQPDGTVVVPQASATGNGQPIVPAQASRVELVIVAISRPQEQFHFETVIANRTN